MQKTLIFDRAAVYISDGVLVVNCASWNTEALHQKVTIAFSQYREDNKFSITVKGHKPKRDIFYGMDPWIHEDVIDIYDPKNFDLFYDESIEEYDTPVLTFWERPLSCLWDKAEKAKWTISRHLKRIKIGKWVEYKRGGMDKVYEANNYIIIHK